MATPASDCPDALPQRQEAQAGRSRDRSRGNDIAGRDHLRAVKANDALA